MLKKILVVLAKKISRKNLINFIKKDLLNLKKTKNDIRLLNVGSGGEIFDLIKNIRFKSVLSIDIDKSRNPDKVIDVCDEDFIQKIDFKPNCIVVCEVIEHLKNPFLAIKNLETVLDKDGYLILSSPFILGIHDAPNDYFRYTEYGLKLLLQNFEIISLKKRNNGIFDIVFVLLVRMFQEKKLSNKIFGTSFLVFYYIFFPIIFMINKIFVSQNLTTGYYVLAKKIN
jgi:hypothetical protein